MDDQKLSIVGKILGVLQILVAVLFLDLNSRNGIMVSVVLFLGGVLTLSADVSSPFLRKARSLLSYITILIAVMFILKLLTIG